MENETQKLLTFDRMVRYNQEVLLPAIEGIVVTKKEFNEFKNVITGFKNETLTVLDSLSKKADILLEDKEIRQYQKEKERKFFAIMIKALKQHNILSHEDLEQISKLEIL